MSDFCLYCVLLKRLRFFVLQESARGSSGQSERVVRHRPVEEGADMERCPQKLQENIRGGGARGIQGYEAMAESLGSSGWLLPNMGKHLLLLFSSMFGQMFSLDS